MLFKKKKQESEYESEYEPKREREWWETHLFPFDDYKNYRDLYDSLRSRIAVVCQEHTLNDVRVDRRIFVRKKTSDTWAQEANDMLADAKQALTILRDERPERLGRFLDATDDISAIGESADDNPRDCWHGICLRKAQALFPDLTKAQIEKASEAADLMNDAIALLPNPWQLQLDPTSVAEELYHKLYERRDG